ATVPSAVLQANEWDRGPIRMATVTTIRPTTIRSHTGTTASARTTTASRIRDSESATDTGSASAGPSFTIRGTTRMAMARRTARLVMPGMDTAAWVATPVAARVDILVATTPRPTRAPTRARSG